MSDPAKRDEAKRLAAEQAWEVHDKCPHCDGTGESPDVAERRVHCMGGFIGADWQLEDVLAEIDGAQEVRWQRGIANHDLRVVGQDGKTWNFQVSNREPADA